MIYILYVVCARYMRQTAGKPAWPGGRFKWNNTSSCYAPSSQAIERMAGYYRALSEPMRLCAFSMSCAAGPSVWEKWPNACNRAMPTFPSISPCWPDRANEQDHAESPALIYKRGESRRAVASASAMYPGCFSEARTTLRDWRRSCTNISESFCVSSSL